MNPAPLSRALQWQAGPTPELVYRCQIDVTPGQQGKPPVLQEWLIRLNDFPRQPLYTLLIDGVEQVDFDAWPACWQR